MESNPTFHLVKEEIATILSELSFDSDKRMYVFSSQRYQKLTFWFLFSSNIICKRMEAVFAWCKGVKFVQVQELTGSFEGTTIRTLRRLEESVRQISVAARAIGNVELQTKFDKASDLIKRDIVFCASLYL